MQHEYVKLVIISNLTIPPQFFHHIYFLLMEVRCSIFNFFSFLYRLPCYLSFFVIYFALLGISRNMFFVIWDRKALQGKHGVIFQVIELWIRLIAHAQTSHVLQIADVEQTTFAAKRSYVTSKLLVAILGTSAKEMLRKNCPKGKQKVTFGTYMI